MPWNPAKPYHPPHIYLDSQVYFVSASTYDRTPLFKDPTAKDIVLKCLREACQTHGIELDAWAILHEHYHLLFPVKRSAQIVPFIRRFHSTTAIAINKLQDCSGRKVWHNYWDYCPRNDHEWRVVINYIHINPIKHRVLPQPEWWSSGTQNAVHLTSGMVQDAHRLLLTYPYSSYVQYQQKFGDEGVMQMWLDCPVLQTWQGDDF